VNAATGQADIAGTAAVPDLAAAVRRAGYAVPETVFDLGIGGMTCASCAQRIERALRARARRAGGAGEPRDRAGPCPGRGGTEEAALGAAVARAGYRLLGRRGDGGSRPGRSAGGGGT
jgi:P-type Cu+ transporter